MNFKLKSNGWLLLLCIIALPITVRAQQDNIFSSDINRSGALDTSQYQELWANKSTTAKEAVEAKIVAATSELNSKSISIVYKKATPPSGDKHDYVSMAPYWWPNPDTESKYPYIRKDGEVNPESRIDYTDQPNLEKIVRITEVLADGYFFSRDEKYAAKAVELLKVFFLNPETKMNPNLKYGQFVPGMNEGRPAGLIETSGLTTLVQTLFLLEGSYSYNAEVKSEMQDWLRSFLEWMSVSWIGIKERHASNNHATHYDSQVVSIYMYLGEETNAQTYLAYYTVPRLSQQVASDGSQPHELGRTKSWNYTGMNMGGFLNLALMADKVGVDLWNLKRGEQILIKSMIDWCVPYTTGEKVWEHKQIAGFSYDRVNRAYRLAARIYNEPKYLKYIK